MVVMALVCLWTPSADGQQPRRREEVGCSIEGQTYLSFGPYDPFLTVDLDSQAQIRYRCYEIDDRIVTARRLTRRPAARRPRQDIEISLSAGQAGDYERRMRGPRGELNYNVYLEANRRNVWGDGSRSTKVHKDRIQPDNAIHTVVAYGRIPAGQSANGGIYADVLVITLDF